MPKRFFVWPLCGEEVEHTLSELSWGPPGRLPACRETHPASADIRLVSAESGQSENIAVGRKREVP